MLAPVFILAFTGHRRIPDDDSVLRRQITLHLQAYQREAARLKGELHVHCSIALGADLIAVECAMSLGIPLHLVLPKPYLSVTKDVRLSGLAEDFAEFEGDGFRASDWARAEAVIQAVKSGSHPGTLREILPLSPAPDCYYDAAVLMLSAADGLLAVWDGQMARGLGGSAEIVDHARIMGLPVQIVAPDVTSSGVDDTVAVSLRTDGLALSLSLFSLSMHDPQSLFVRLDREAELLGSSFRMRLARAIRYHFYATLLAALSACLITSQLLRDAAALTSFIGGCFGASAWWIQRKDGRIKRQARWLELRFAAELVRSVLATRHLSDPLYPGVQKFRPEWTRFARTISLSLSEGFSRCDDTWIERRALYVADRLERQVAYFDERRRDAEEECARIRIMAAFATRSAPIVVLVGLAYKTALHFGHFTASGLDRLFLPELLIFLPIALSLLAGYLGTIRQASDAERRRVRYAELSDELRSRLRNIVHLRTKAAVSAAVKEAEELLLTEQLEWRTRESQFSRV